MVLLNQFMGILVYINMQELFSLYSKVSSNDQLSPEMFRKEVDSLKDVSNMWLLEVVYSFFMLGYNSNKS
jgi:hypothetical protein